MIASSYCAFRMLNLGLSSKKKNTETKQIIVGIDVRNNKNLQFPLIKNFKTFFLFIIKNKINLK